MQKFAPKERSLEERDLMFRQRREWIEAAEARDAWAREHGCIDFQDAMRIGLVAVAKRKSKSWEPE
jgi:hypothetical protein